MDEQQTMQGALNTQISDGDNRPENYQDPLKPHGPQYHYCDEETGLNFRAADHIDCSQCNQVENLQLNLREANKGLTELMLEMEERVNRRTEQLQAVNEELDAFAYSVSHDLRQPLRVIGGFSEALLEDYKAKLDDVGLDYLMRIHRGTDRMASLIDDLMHLTKITGGSIEKKDIDLSEIASPICEQIRESDAERQVEFVIPSGLHASGDPRLMHVALENLLRNAWKFTANTPNPKIEIGMLEDAREKTYFVRDNGAGFDMAYADKLFGAFERAHRESEFPGNGIGLATVRRTISRHGGKIWAEGKEGAGATFFFTL